ncbi:hypothetical protein RHGRI_020418 [Rhododendron griersonianum]|uniref:Dirigent protein n=1 Tax=Rhododendron griersonianum TaxID=479676 RepID=A0AAV6JJL3_9ERIC|nr:hypothetical protein RHGRI_020418 [Rhododendron griersonianum]
MLFSVAASTVAEEDHAKESSSKKFTPKDVVLYRWDSGPPQSEHNTSVARLQSEQNTSAIGLLGFGNWLVQGEIRDIRRGLGRV